MSLLPARLGAIVENGERISGAGLLSAVRARAKELAALGCREGSCVALVQGNEAAFFVNLFALWEIGACAVPLSPTATESETESALSHSGAELVYRGGAFTARTATGEAPPVGTALLLYTSGSTGAPKGVMLSRDAVLSKVRTLLGLFPDSVLERVLCLLPVSFGHGLIGNSLPALFSGTELHLEPAFSSAITARLGEFLDSRAITFFSSVPALWSAVLPFAAPPAGKTLRRAFCASADLSVPAWGEAKAWLGEGVDFRNVYGITEAASWISALPEGEAYDEKGAVGKGWNCEFRIDPSSGEILVRAPYLMAGYHRDPAGTATSFQGGFFRTGDTGNLHGERGLRVLGRLKDVINRGGLKVSPAEVEERLRAHPGVSDCCVFGYADEVTGQAVGAAVVARGAAPSAKELRDFCRATLSEFKIPEKFFFLEELPRSARGKVNRSEVAAACGKGRP